MKTMKGLLVLFLPSFLAMAVKAQEITGYWFNDVKDA